MSYRVKNDFRGTNKYILKTLISYYYLFLSEKEEILLINTVILINFSTIFSIKKCLSTVILCQKRNIYVLL